MSADLNHLTNAFDTNSKLVTWEQDYADRVNPELMTQLLWDSIPVVKHIGWRIEEISEGYCRSRLPLNYESTNQHGSHQAALIAIAADYTGGVAIASLLRGVPIGGVHPGNDSKTAALWLASMQVKYRAPSTGDLLITCKIPHTECELIQKRYFEGRRVLTRLKVTFSSNDEAVAEAEMTYFAQPSKQLRPTTQNPKISTLYKHKLKASARMIAGLRGGLGGTGSIKVHCPHSKVIAGPHGQLLARRLNSILPQLQDMVVCRTQHVDEHLLAGLQNDLKQIVLVGVGLDVRAFGYGPLAGQAKFYEVDLPEMLDERNRVISALSESKLDRVAISMNFATDRLDEVLLQHDEFDPLQATAFVYEGCTMYLDEVTNSAVLAAMHRLARHPSSFVWADFVATDVIRGNHQIEEVASFLKGMDQLGEAFIFGVDDPGQYLGQFGFDRIVTTQCSELVENDDPVFSLYRFAVARNATVAPET